MNKKEDKVVFEDYGIEFSEKEIEGLDQESLIRCKRKVQDLLKEIDRKIKNM